PAVGAILCGADGRATLRSERGLDEDRAVQGAVLGRLLQTLGFDQEALQVGARGAEQDATNPAAHGIVADLLRRRERQEIAAVSAALAEQVWRSPSKQSLDPTRQETSLAALDGPAAARPSFAELGPYFESDGFRGAVSGFGGTQERFGGQVSGALLHEGWSASAAVSHEQDQGYRFNNEAYTTIAGAELRGALDAATDFFLEYRYRSSDFGDRVLEFDTSTGNPVTDQSLERNVIRAGIKRRIGADHDIAGVIAFERGVRMTIDDAVPEVAAAANPDRLLQILINLLSNGIKYNGHTEPRITLHARTESGRVEIDVADNGGGVTAEEAEDIFAKFTRGTRAPLDRGAGLGLPISRAMAERMGGTLAVVFREDGTSFFRVTLPLASPSPARAAE
ncbi:MAG: ATP-binding protein, partial [Pseudomonadota bacterium]